MTARQFNLTDRILSELDTALRVVAARPSAARTMPASDAPTGDESLTDSQRTESARLMRVNHAGEIAAQALYRGQALLATDSRLREELLQAADEEHDHLVWCEQRASQLGGRTSRLAPLWYGGSFLIGMAAGLAGDKLSLGFLAETEQQVTEHLDGHLERLPAHDRASRDIVSRMRDEEMAHCEGAIARGGSKLPVPVSRAMRLVAGVMTSVSYRV
jgi:ubiquinone biosynthesis monooxygenase Coq7